MHLGLALIHKNKMFAHTALPYVAPSSSLGLAGLVSNHEAVLAVGEVEILLILAYTLALAFFGPANASLRLCAGTR